MIRRRSSRSDDPGVERLLSGARGGDEQQVGRAADAVSQLSHDSGHDAARCAAAAADQPLGPGARGDARSVSRLSKVPRATERELLAWLRQILINCLHHAYEAHIQAGRRDIRREVSLDDMNRAMDRSVVRLAHVLADTGRRRASRLHERERAVAIADQLAKLKPDDRDVIVLRNLQGLVV